MNIYAFEYEDSKFDVIFQKNIHLEMMGQRAKVGAYVAKTTLYIMTVGKSDFFLVNKHLKSQFIFFPKEKG